MIKEFTKENLIGLHETAKRVHKIYFDMVQPEAGDSLFFTKMLEKWQRIAGALIYDHHADADSPEIDPTYEKWYGELITIPLQILHGALTERLAELNKEDLESNMWLLEMDEARWKDKPLAYARHIIHCMNNQFESLENLTGETYPRIERI